ncbi:hypothetical protein QR680_015609 [Steinernema hermaphroditum]|uniref:G-protein coupled receptors family 1 profile domain-containing protein n=1 Tax=Steinernema hermaphroditum TaxID=289476 RepID=A0AA39H8E4_9BILA|nr:hypothetical protein QR680_015609 [Steinernema hermaphroditum]
MAVSDVVSDFEIRYEMYRYVIIFNTACAIPLNLFTAYLILTKSPKQLSIYKYILLNISLWIFLTDINLGILLLPLPIAEIYAIYATGLIKPLGPTVGFASFAATGILVGEYLVALLFAFFYRYYCIKYGTKFVSKKNVSALYWMAAVSAMIVPPGTMTGSILNAFVDREEF